MGLSLRDQLLQAGFAAPRPEPKPRDRRPAQSDTAGKQQRPGKAPVAGKPAATPSGDVSLAQAYQLRAETEKREREEAQRRAQAEAERKREQRRKLAALVAGRALNDPKAEFARNFIYGKKIRKVHVSAEQLRQLNAGELGVAQIDGRYLILAPEAIREILALAPQHVALFVPEGIGASDVRDEDYSDPRFQVPDDLVW